MRRKVLIFLASILLAASCNVKKEISKTKEYNSGSESSKENYIEEIHFTRPSIDYVLKRDLLDSDGILRPVYEVYKKDGVIVVVEVNDKGELKASFTVPSDTVKKKREVYKESESNQESLREATEKSIKKTGPGWFSFAIPFLIAGVLIYIFFKFKLYKLIFPWI